MKVHLDCFPCFLRQALIALRLGTGDESLQEKILKSVLEDIENADTKKPPAFTTTFIHRRIREELRKDPFKQIKSRYNQIALEMFPSLKALIERSEDPLWTSTRLAIAGNIIDFGIFTSIDIEGTIDKALHNHLAKDDYELLKEAIFSATEILYLTDNAGEIVFDKLLIETLIRKGKKIKAVVKGGPVINDCTIEDAQEVGLTEICEVIDNGSDAVGTILDLTSQSFQQTFRESQLVISKGQGNFETLMETQKNIFFLFQAKCDVICKELNLPPKAMILKKS